MSFTISSNDGTEVKFIKEHIAKLSHLVKEALKDEPKADKVQISRPTSDLKKIVEYVEHYKDDDSVAFKVQSVDQKTGAKNILSEWDYTFIQKCKTPDDPLLFSLTTTVEELQMDNLVKKLACDLATHFLTKGGIDPDALAKEFAAKVSIPSEAEVSVKDLPKKKKDEKKDEKKD